MLSPVYYPEEEKLLVVMNPLIIDEIGEYNLTIIVNDTSRNQVTTNYFFSVFGNKKDFFTSETRLFSFPIFGLAGLLILKTSMKIEVGYCIYLPPGYDEPKNKARRYPVVYYHGPTPRELSSERH